MKLRLKPVVRSLAVAFGGLSAVITFPAAAQQQQQLERVEITGSAIRRVENEGALPVQVISKEEIAKSGVQSTQELLLQVSAISTIGGTQSAEGAGNSVYGASTASLRGLGDQRTLVLINGRRLANSATSDGVNLNNLPLSAIERVEVLKDGASALYGSDAIAGVINFILRRNYTGFEMSGSVGMPTDSGGGENYKVGLIGGFGDFAKDGWNITAGFNWEKQNKIWSKDRDYAKTGNVEPYLFAGATGQGNIEGGIDPTKRDPGTGMLGLRLPGFGASPGTGYGNPLAPAGKCADINMYKNFTKTSRGYDYCTFDSPAYLALIPDREMYGFTLNGAFKLGEKAELFGDALWSESKTTFPIQQSPVRRSFLISDARFLKEDGVPAMLLRPTNPNYQIAADYLKSIGQGALVGQTLAVTSRVFDFGNRTSEDTSTQTRLLVGVRGEVFNQNYEVAYSWNENKVEGSVIAGYFSQFDFVKAINDPSSDYNPWSLTQSPAMTAAIGKAAYVGPTLNATLKSQTLDGKLTGEMFNLPAGPAMYAAGAAFAKDKLSQNPSPALLSGDIAGLGGATAALDVDRDITSFWGEVVVPVVKTFDLTGGLRWDDYNDVGSKTTYKVSARWQPIKQVLLRAAYGTGFRAPSMSDLYTPQTLGTSAQFNDPVSGQNNLQVSEWSGGNPNLKPEKSDQTSIGIILQPVPEFAFGVDYFKVNVQDIIAQPSTQEVVSGFRAGNPAYADKVVLSPSGDIDTTYTVFVNSGDAKVSGYDVTANYGKTFDWGRVGLGLTGTYYTQFQQTSPGGYVSQKVATMVEPNGDPVLDADTGGVTLRWKHQLVATYGYGAWGFTLVQNYYSGYETGNRQWDGERNFIDNQAIYDFQVAYTGLKNATFRLGVNNFLNTDPPIFVPVSNQFQAGYDATLYDPRGRFVYLTASYKFF